MAHRTTLCSEIDQSSQSLDLEEHQENSIYDTRFTRSTSGILRFGSENEIKRHEHSHDGNENKNKVQITTNIFHVSSVDAVKESVACQKSAQNYTEVVPGHLVGSRIHPTSFDTERTLEDQTRISEPDTSPKGTESQYDIDIELMPYTTEDLKEALGEIREEVTRYCSPPDQKDSHSLANKILVTAGSSLMHMLGVNKKEEDAKKLEGEGTASMASTCPKNNVVGDTDMKEGYSTPTAERNFESSDEELVSLCNSGCTDVQHFMGELVSPREADSNDISDHEIVSKSDLTGTAENTEFKDGAKSPENERNPSSRGGKKVRFLLDEKDTDSSGLTKKVSGIFSSSSSSLSIASSSSTSDFAMDLPGCIEPIIEEVSDSSGPAEAGGIEYIDEICELPSPKIYFAERELPLINCPNQEHLFELEDIIPNEISSAPPISSVDMNFEDPQRRISPDELVFAPIKPVVDIPVCDTDCGSYYSAMSEVIQGEHLTGATAENIASASLPQEPKTLPASFTVLEPDPHVLIDDVGCLNTSFIHDPVSETSPIVKGIGFPDEVQNGIIEGHPGSFTANDLPMTLPATFKHSHRCSGDSSSEDGRCSAGSMEVMPSESNESLTTATETCSTSLEKPDTNNLIEVAPPVVLKRSLYYLSQIHQLEKMVQDGKRHVQSLQEESTKRDQEYEAELLALRQSLQRELEESRTQGWMVEKRLTEQVKCLTADNGALMRQVNHITNRMQESERINTMIVAQYHNALSTLQAMEKEYKSAQKKIRELHGRLETEMKSDSGTKETVEGLLKNKEEMLQSIQKLEDRLLGQKDVNSRLLSEIEKTKEEKQKETKRICEEKEREFRIKTDQLKNKLDLQIVKLRKEHSTTEILKAEFTSIRRDLESQIAARDVKIEELRRQIQTDNERENGSKKEESDMAGSRGEQAQVEKNAEDKEELKRKESKIRVLENALTDENKKFVDLQASLKESEVHLTMLQEDMERREQLLADASESCRRLKRQKNDLDEQVQNQSSEIVLLREYLASRDRRIVQMAADLSRRDRRIMTLLKDLRQQQDSPKTGPMANSVKEASSSSSSSLTLDLVMAGKTDEGSLSDQTSDDRNDKMEEAMSNLEKQLQTLKQYKSDADERIQTLLRDLEESKTQVDEVRRLEREKGELQEYVTNLEKDMGIHDLSPQLNVIQRLQALFHTKEEEFTAELAALQNANKDMQGIIKEKEEFATKREKMNSENSDKMKLELEKYREELSDMKEEMDRNGQSADTQIGSLTSLLTSYKQHIDSQEHLRHDADQMVGHYISENTQLKTKLEQSHLEHENMAKELAAAENLKSYCVQEKEKVEKELEELKTKYDLIKSDKLEERDQHKTIVEDLSQKLEQKCNELSTTSHNLEQVLAQVGHASDRSQELSRRLGEKEDEVHDLNVQLLKVDGQRNRIEAEKTVLESRLDALSQKIEELETARTESKEALCQKEGRTEELSKEITDLNMRLTCEMNNYEHLKTLHLNLEEKSRSQIEQIHHLQTEIVNLKGQWAIKTNDLKKTKEMKDHLENELKSYHLQFTEMTSQIDELKQLRETEGELFEEMKVKRDLESKNKGEAEEKCRKAQEKIEKLQKTLRIKRKKIVKLQQERANLATQEVETSSTVNPGDPEARSQEHQNRQEATSTEALQQQLLQQRQQQLLHQELQMNRAAHITNNIAELQECLKDSRLKLGQLTENQEALSNENELLNQNLETLHAALDDEKTKHQETIGKMKKLTNDLKHKRVELHKAKREIRCRSREAERTLSTLNQNETIRNDLSQENTQLVITCREKDAQITLLHEIIKTHQDQINEPDTAASPQFIFKDCDHEGPMRDLERKIEAAEGEIRSIKALNCRLNIDMQVKCDALTNQKAECTRLQTATYDLQQVNWDLKQKLADAKYKLQTEKQLRKLLEQRHDDELNDIKMKSSLLEDREKERGTLHSKEIQRKLSRLEQRLQKQEVQPVNISDDQRQINGLKSEIERLGTLRDLDRQALDGLTADLGAIKSLMTSEIHLSTNQNSSNQQSRTESRASRVQQALRKAELSAIRMTSLSTTQSDVPIGNLLGLSDELADVSKSDS